MTGPEPPAPQPPHERPSPSVQAVLDGRASYDELTTDEEQAAVRAAWDERIARRRGALYDMTAELEARGTPYYSADSDGRILEHIPGVGVRPYTGPTEGRPLDR